MVSRRNGVYGVSAMAIQDLQLLYYCVVRNYKGGILIKHFENSLRIKVTVKIILNIIKQKMIVEMHYVHKTYKE